MLSDILELRVVSQAFGPFHTSITCILCNYEWCLQFSRTEIALNGTILSKWKDCFKWTSTILRAEYWTSGGYRVWNQNMHQMKTLCEIRLLPKDGVIEWCLLRIQYECKLTYFPDLRFLETRVINYWVKVINAKTVLITVTRREKSLIFDLDLAIMKC